MGVSTKPGQWNTCLLQQSVVRFALPAVLPQAKLLPGGELAGCKHTAGPTHVSACPAARSPTSDAPVAAKLPHSRATNPAATSHSSSARVIDSPMVAWLLPPCGQSAAAKGGGGTYKLASQLRMRLGVWRVLLLSGHCESLPSLGLLESCAGVGAHRLAQQPRRTVFCAAVHTCWRGCCLLGQLLLLEDDPQQQHRGTQHAGHSQKHCIEDANGMC